MKNEDVRNDLISSNSKFANACDRFFFRIDFYSKPKFCDIFIDRFNNYLIEKGLRNIPYSYQPLNRFQQRIVYTDSIAESLNTSLEQITIEPVYIYRELQPLISQEKSSQNEQVSLFVSPYYIAINISNFSINHSILDFLEWIYNNLEELWDNNTISIADIQISFYASEVLSIESYKNLDGIGGYTPINDSNIHNQWSSSQFIVDDLDCTITNILRLSDVENENHELEKMWEHVISSVCIRKFDSGKAQEPFKELLNRMFRESDKCIELLCAK